MADKHLGYIATPYTGGSVDLNVRAHCKLFSMLRATNRLIPIAPLWADIQEKNFPEKYQYFVDYDNDLIRSLPLKWIIRARASAWDDLNQCGYHYCDSPGADAEIELARETHPDIIIIVQNKIESYESLINRLIDEIDYRYPE